MRCIRHVIIERVSIGLKPWLLPERLGTHVEMPAIVHTLKLLLLILELCCPSETLVLDQITSKVVCGITLHTSIWLKLQGTQIHRRCILRCYRRRLPSNALCAWKQLSFQYIYSSMNALIDKQRILTVRHIIISQEEILMVRYLMLKALAYPRLVS